MHFSGSRVHDNARITIAVFISYEIYHLTNLGKIIVIHSSDKTTWKESTKSWITLDIQRMSQVMIQIRHFVLGTLWRSCNVWSNILWSTFFFTATRIEVWRKEKGKERNSHPRRNNIHLLNLILGKEYTEYEFYELYDTLSLIQIKWFIILDDYIKLNNKWLLLSKKRKSLLKVCFLFETGLN